jgi:hypothetical protein
MKHSDKLGIEKGDVYNCRNSGRSKTSLFREFEITLI